MPAVATIRLKTSKMMAIYGWQEEAEAPTGAGAAPDVHTCALT